jgi:hypothetical protein
MKQNTSVYLEHNDLNHLGTMLNREKANVLLDLLLEQFQLLRCLLERRSIPTLEKKANLILRYGSTTFKSTKNMDFFIY